MKKHSELYVGHDGNVAVSEAPIVLKVLLVEDYPSGMIIGTMMMECLGYTVEKACCGLEAIDKVRATSHAFFAILVDLEMSDMDGFELTKRIRTIEQYYGHINTIIALSSQTYAVDRQQCLDVGMNDYISKPIRFAVLAQKLARIPRVVA
jgi:two-component system sensor histidine kinase/response regulator